MFKGVSVRQVVFVCACVRACMCVCVCVCVCVSVEGEAAIHHKVTSEHTTTYTMITLPQGLDFRDH